MTHLILTAVLLARLAAAQVPVTQSTVPVAVPGTTVPVAPVIVPPSTLSVPISIVNLPTGCTWTATGGAKITITVVCPAPPPVFAITTPVTLPSGTAGHLYTANLATLVAPHGGVAPYKFAAGPGFPVWLTLTPSGSLSGTPPAAGTFSLQFTVTDSSTTPTNGGTSAPFDNAATFTVSR